MDNWLDRVDPTRPFLVTAERTWTYGETAAEIAARHVDETVHLAPRLHPGSVFDVLAAVFGGGAIIGLPAGDPAGAPLVVPTSGTTGPPRGVRLTMSNLEAAVKASASHLGHGPDDVWLLALPLHHVAGLSILFRQAWAGGSVHMLPSFDPASAWISMAKGVTMLSLVPAMLHRMLEVGGRGCGLRSVLVGGGPIPAGLLERAEARGLPVRPTYGMTETFGQVATLRPDAPLARKVHPLPGVELRIEEGGIVALKGAQVSPGYLEEPDRESEWLVTNDLGELDAEGALRILGRADTVIISGGENVSPERVEAELTEHPHVDDAVVVGIPDPEWGERVGCAYSGQVDPGDLADWLRERLPRFMIPKTWARVAAIPRSSIGKPDRRAASAMLAGEVT